MTQTVYRTLSADQRHIVWRVALGWSYPQIATEMGRNTRICRHHADVAARKLLPNSKLPTRQRLTLWWERRNK